MKKILLIAILGLILTSCTEQMKAKGNRLENAPIVKDEFGVSYRIVTIEGCEFYMSHGDSQSGLTKVDCDCVPDKSNR